MPFDPSKPRISAAVINSVACGAEGSLLKKRLTKETCDAFPSSEAFANVRSFVEACAMSVEGLPLPAPAVPLPSPDASSATTAVPPDGVVVPTAKQAVATAETSAAATAYLRDTPLRPFLAAVTNRLFPALHAYVDAIPLEDMKAQRFGNKAFRAYCQKMADDLLEGVVKAHLLPAVEAIAAASGAAQSPPPTVAAELYEYLLDSFGNAQRIDYGTGHELHFWCFCYTAVVHATGRRLPTSTTTGADADADAAKKDEAAEKGLRDGLADLVLVVFPQYLAFCRRLQHHYSLEPAGSHGVWGLDDYHHLPLLFGASQLVGAEPAILPKHITDRTKVAANRPKYLYFEMIGWIMDNKKGPFHEHSPILYNVSGLDEWARIRQGMMKMYAAEVMGRFAVVQHFLFGPTIAYKEA